MSSFVSKLKSEIEEQKLLLARLEGELDEYLLGQSIVTYHLPSILLEPAKEVKNETVFFRAEKHEYVSYYKNKNSTATDTISIEISPTHSEDKSKRVIYLRKEECKSLYYLIKNIFKL